MTEKFSVVKGSSEADVVGICCWFHSLPSEAVQREDFKSFEVSIRIELFQQKVKILSLSINWNNFPELRRNPQATEQYRACMWTEIMNISCNKLLSMMINFRKVSTVNWLLWRKAKSLRNYWKFEMGKCNLNFVIFCANEWTLIQNVTKVDVNSTLCCFCCWLQSLFVSFIKLKFSTSTTLLTSPIRSNRNEAMLFFKYTGKFPFVYNEREKFCLRERKTQILLSPFSSGLNLIQFTAGYGVEQQAQFFN